MFDDARKAVLIVLFIPSDSALDSLRAFCEELGRETKQGEIGIVIDGNYIAIRGFEEEV